MGELNLVAIGLGALVFFAVGAVWYGPLFGRPWRALNGITDEAMAAGPRPGQNPTWLIMALAFAFSVLIALMLGHQFAMTTPSDRGMMMIAIGYGATLMAPALGIHYLFQRQSGKLFAIDAGYLVVGMAAMGAVFAALT